MDTVNGLTNVVTTQNLRLTKKRDWKRRGERKGEEGRGNERERRNAGIR